MGLDKVCLLSDNDKSCVTQDFFLITQATGLGEVDGILGLAPPTVYNGPSFFQSLDLENYDMWNIISMQLGNANQISFITFGAVSPNQFTGAVITHNTCPIFPNYWTLNLTSIVYDGDAPLTTG